MVWQWLRVDKEHLYSGEQANWPLDDYDMDSESLLLLLHHAVSARWCGGSLPSASTGGMYRTVRTQDTNAVLGSRAGMSFADGNNVYFGLAESECELDILELHVLVESPP